MNQSVYDRGSNFAVAFPALMTKVYTWMALALTITGLSAWYVAHSPVLLTYIYTNQPVFWGLIIAEFALVWGVSGAINRISAPVATLLFILYSIVNGVTLSSIFVVYELASIGKVFFITAGTFGAMALVGHTTKKDLSSMGRIAFMGLIGLIIASLVNMFFKSSGLDLICSYLGVLIFVGLTAYDVQKIKKMTMYADPEDAASQKMAVLGALSLYLDFVNLFLYLLRILGDRR